MLLVKNPKNETPAHYELKQISKYLARHRGCTIIAEEVSGFADKTISKKKKGVVDVGAIKLRDVMVRELPEITTYGFEAKASLVDFKNGFNAGAHYTYVIAPKGVINKKLIPSGIGFYEVNLNDYSIGYDKIYHGIELVKKPKRRNTKKHYKTNFLQMKYVAARATNQDIFSNSKIVLADNERV